MYDLLQRLSDAHGISGYEGNVRAIVRQELSSYGDVRVDVPGNLIVTKKGTTPSIMLAAHIDEIGFAVKHIDDNGFLKFVKVGGWFDQTLLNQRVIVHSKDPCFGVIGSKPPHVMKEDERKKPVESKDMFIDVGASSADEVASMGIEIGTSVSIDQNLVRLAGDRVTGKALDNRAGAALLIEVMKRISDIKPTVHAVFTVQEEVGLKGARTAAFGLDPDVAIAIDTCIAGDHPGITKDESAMEVGKGAAITVMDAGGRGVITHPKVLAWLRETAEKNKIAYQLDVSDGGTTDATAISLTRAGIPAGVISVTTRYLHSPVEVLSLADMESCADLIAHAVRTAGKWF
ncbi:MAG: Tetrahedral aminopeptidase [ANME-2 cluster archaeon]|nr:Tetrahedral aminopeptidase [ANME-2 cluster archaeon]